MWGHQNQVTVYMSPRLYGLDQTQNGKLQNAFTFLSFEKWGEPRKPFELDKMKQSIQLSELCASLLVGVEVRYLSSLFFSGI